MPETWEAEMAQPSERWIWVPNAGELDTSGAETWVEDVLASLRDTWDGEWTDEVDPGARALLAHHLAGDLHPGTLAAMLHWPLPAPVVSRVRVVLGGGEPTSPEEWRQQGFDVDEYAGAALGPGLRCLASRTGEIDGETVEFLTGIFVFSTQEVSVMVVVEAGAPEIFGLTIADMPLFLAELEVVRPDGTPFSAEPVPGVTSDPFDAWEDPSFV